MKEEEGMKDKGGGKDAYSRECDSLCLSLLAISSFIFLHPLLIPSLFLHPPSLSFIILLHPLLNPLLIPFSFFIPSSSFIHIERIGAKRNFE
jgi:uncharacterized RDD family membrane protein YckC